MVGPPDVTPRAASGAATPFEWLSDEQHILAARGLLARMDRYDGDSLREAERHLRVVPPSSRLRGEARQVRAMIDHWRRCGSGPGTCTLPTRSSGDTESDGDEGRVYVRGHMRNGHWVRPYTRRR